MKTVSWWSVTALVSLTTLSCSSSDPALPVAVAATGGTTGGGEPLPSEPHVAADLCNDTPSNGFELSDQYGIAEVDVNGGAKSYIMATNWWSSYNGQSISGTGNNFTISGGAGDANANEGAPAGFPTLFLGSYSGNTSKGNPLPLQVSSLTSVPTEFRTNGAQFAMDYYNAAYDVWFTASPAGVPEGQYDPGVGGAYLMVWTFDPSEKRPRGSVFLENHVVPGVTGTWDVWVDTTDPPCISYVATEATNDLGFDLKLFIDDSIGNSFGITSEMYLSIVFAGFEVWAGGDGLTANEFCVNVQ